MKKQVCIYCGGLATTHDHIPPKNIFPKPRPNDLITVPSCSACNQGFSRDDEYFRTMIACSESTADHPQAMKLWEGKILRQFRCQGESALMTLIDQSFGTQKPTDAEFRSAELRIAGVLHRIVKALYYVEMGTVPPLAWEFRVCLSTGAASSGDVPELQDIFEVNIGCRVRSIGCGVFSYRMIELPGPERRVAWLLVFFEKLPFICTLSH